MPLLILSVYRYRYTYKLLPGSADRRPQRHGLLGRSHQEPGRGEENIFMMSIFTNSNAGLPRWTCTACSGAQWDPAPLTRQTPWHARWCRYLLIYSISTNIYIMLCKYLPLSSIIYNISTPGCAGQPAAWAQLRGGGEGG